MFKKLLSVMLILLTTISLSGCLTTQINRGTASNLVEYLYPNGEAVDHSQDEIPHLKLPLKVGVAFVPESGSYFNASLNEASKQKLLEKVVKKGEAVKFSYRKGYGGGSMGLWGCLCLVLLILFSRRR